MHANGIPVSSLWMAELEAVLPSDIPNRDFLIRIAAHHLQLVEAGNQLMNLTSITAPREAAIKHVLDSVTPWPRLEGTQKVLDVGSGAGFPGIPLAAVFPQSQWTLAESIGKKAKFLGDSLDQLELTNANVRAERAEALLKTAHFDATVVRAVGAIEKLLRVLGPGIRNAGKLVLYKGPAPETEMKEAQPLAERMRLRGSIAMRYELPFDFGSRTVVEYRSF